MRSAFWISVTPSTPRPRTKVVLLKSAGGMIHTTFLIRHCTIDDAISFLLSGDIILHYVKKLERIVFHGGKEKS